MKLSLTAILTILYYQLIAQGISEGIFHYESGNTEKSKKIFTMHLKKDLPADSLYLCSHYLSGLYYYEDSVASALQYAHLALEYAWRTGEKEPITKSYMRIFQAQYKWHNYTAALQTVKHALDNSPDERMYHRNLYNLGLVYKQLEMPDSALMAYTRSYDYFLAHRDTSWVCLLLNETGLAYYYSGNYAKARAAYFDLLDYSEHTGYGKYAGWALNNIGNSYEKEGKRDSAFHYLTLALPYKSGRHRMSTLYNLAKVSDDPYPYLIAAKNAYSDELDIQDYKRILLDLRAYHHHTDSMNYYANLVADLTLKGLEKENILDAYSKKLKILEVEHQIREYRMARERRRERIYWTAGICGLILLMLGGFWAYIVLYRKRWLPQWMKFRMELLEYQVREFRKTLHQMRKS